MLSIKKIVVDSSRDIDALVTEKTVLKDIDANSISKTIELSVKQKPLSDKK